MNLTNKKKIVIIDLSPVIRQGIKSLLRENAAELSIIGDYSSIQAFRDDHIPDSAFDIILINPSVINFYQQFNVRNLFSDYTDIIIVAILYGYVDSETLNSFDGALDIYDDGEKMAKKLKKITGIHRNYRNMDRDDLSEREKEILVAIAKGMINKEIADKHCISIHTVISHRKNITRKTGIKTVSGLTVYALFNNLVAEDDL